MLKDNIRRERKKAGLTQDELAGQLHVVRQTISKWEKGLSVPDSSSLEKMAEIFEVSVAILLDSSEQENENISQKEILRQLTIFNERNAEKQRRIGRIKKTWWRIAIAAVGAIFVFWLVLLSVDTVRLKGNRDISKKPIITISAEGYAPEYMLYRGFGYTVYYSLTGNARFTGGEIRVLGIPLVVWE